MFIPPGVTEFLNSGRRHKTMSMDKLNPYLLSSYLKAKVMSTTNTKYSHVESVGRIFSFSSANLK